MANLDLAVEQLKEAKTRLAELLSNKTRLESESERLESLLQATESEVEACIKERREFIEGGGDVFDSHSSKLRKQELSHAVVIDDLKFAIDTNNKAVEAMLLDLSAAHDAAMGKARTLVGEMIADLIAKVLQNPPVELLKACHLATQVHFEEGFSFFLATLAVSQKTTYENAFNKKMSELFRGEFAALSTSDYRNAIISEEEKALLSIPVLKDKLSPAQAHVIKASRNKPVRLGALYQLHPELLGSDSAEARSRNLVEA